MRIYQIKHEALASSNCGQSVEIFGPTSATAAAKMAREIATDHGRLASVYFAEVPTAKKDLIRFLDRGGFNTIRQHVVSFDADGSKLEDEPEWSDGEAGEDEGFDPFDDSDEFGADPAAPADPDDPFAL